MGRESKGGVVLPLGKGLVECGFVEGVKSEDRGTSVFHATGNNRGAEMEIPRKLF